MSIIQASLDSSARRDDVDDITHSRTRLPSTLLLKATLSDAALRLVEEGLQAGKQTFGACPSLGRGQANGIDRTSTVVASASSLRVGPFWPASLLDPTKISTSMGTGTRL